MADRYSSFLYGLHRLPPHLRSRRRKARNLMRLVQAGMPVPDGFVITTDGYHEWFFR